MADTMIERVARAIEDSFSIPDSGHLEWTYEHAARAAIEAMRVPTPAMIGGMRDNIGPLVEMWRAAIDAALLEEQP